MNSSEILQDIRTKKRDLELQERSVFKALALTRFYALLEGTNRADAMQLTSTDIGYMIDALFEEPEDVLRSRIGWTPSDTRQGVEESWPQHRYHFVGQRILLTIENLYREGSLAARLSDLSYAINSHPYGGPT